MSIYNLLRSNTILLFSREFVCKDNSNLRLKNYAASLAILVHIHDQVNATCFPAKKTDQHRNAERNRYAGIWGRNDKMQTEVAWTDVERKSDADCVKASIK